MPIFHECQRCTACCRWPGEVRLRDGEPARLAAHLGLTEVEFIQRHTRITSDRRGLSLVELPSGACEFLQGNDCAVQPVKPQQCRDFPNLWNFPGFEKTCRAIPQRVSPEEYVRLVEKATGRRVDPPAETDDAPVTVPIENVLDLHSFRPTEIRAVVEAYLDACHEHGLREVRLVHGKGIGQLRQTVHALLKNRPDVARFDLAGEAWGGSGATIVQLLPIPPKRNNPA